MFSMVDAFHFNSQNTADIYGKYIDVPAASKVIPIAHGGIKDHRKLRYYNESLLKLGFVGSEAPYKGLPLLKEVIERINQEGHAHKLVLNVYGGRTGKDERLPNVTYKGRFTSEMMERVYNDNDMIVVPSVWNETFSFVTLETLSYGTPVLVSDHVGAKDIVMKYAPDFVFHDADDLYNLINRLIKDRQLLIDYNNSILEGAWRFSIEDHARTIVEELYV